MMGLHVKQSKNARHQSEMGTLMTGINILQ